MLLRHLRLPLFALFVFSLLLLTLPASRPAAAQTGTLIARINAGGPAITTSSGDWSADQWFSGGTSSTTGSGQDILNTDEDVLYQSARGSSSDFGSFRYAIPVPQSGNYQMTLHFAETYWGAPGGASGGVGSRVFDVNLEGGSVELDNYDIFAAAGGAMRAISATVTINVTDGTLNMAFTRVANRPRVSGIELRLLASSATTTPSPTTASATPTSATNTPTATSATNTPTATSAAATATSTPTRTPTVTATPTATPPPLPSIPGVIARINAGGPALTTADGRAWLADSYFSGGRSTATSSGADIAATADDALYADAHTADVDFGSFSYALPVPQPGYYVVNLHFAEIF
jgi:hypothetical protein